MEKKTQFSIWYFAFAVLAVRDIVAGMYRRTRELLHARETLLRESAAELLERETPGESDLERISTIAAAPALPLPKAA